MPRALTFILVLCLASTAVATEEKPAEKIPVGKIVPKVVCKDSPKLTYALYLPSTYDAEKKWPVIFGFSPGARGLTPVSLLKDAAEKYGYIVAGSNDSRNGPMEPILAARAAVWKDVNARFSVNAKRSYATGFSGGSRVALDMALVHHDRFAGVISCGAFYAPGRPFPEKSHLVFFGLAGDSCFNNPEHVRADTELEQRGRPHWFEEFSGGHSWPSAALMTEAVEFLQLAAMRAGQITDDPEFPKTLLKSRLAGAAALVKSGQKLLALRKYRQTAKLFAKLEDAAKAAEQAKALAEDEEVKAILKQRKELADLSADLRNPAEKEKFAAAIAKFREIAAGEGPLAARAKMTLQMLMSQLQRAGVKALTDKDFGKAVRYLTLVHDTFPEDASTAYNLACALSLKGDSAKAVEMLAKAVANGFTDLTHIKADPDLDPIREEAGYLEIVKKLGGE